MTVRTTPVACQAPPPSPVPSTYPDPIPHLVPFGGLCLLAGPPKCGKTALLAEWFVRWRDGRPICGLPTGRPTGLGFLTTDHKWHLNQGPWFTAVGWPEIPHVSLRDNPTLPWRQLKIPTKADEILKRALDQLNLPPGGMVCIDVLGPFITSRLNDYAEVVGGLGTIAQIMDERQLTCLAVAHMGKTKGDPKDQYRNPFERILGSGAQIGFSDTMFYLLGPDDLNESYYEVGWKPTHAPAGTFRFTRDAFGLFVPHGVADPLGVSTRDHPDSLAPVVAVLPEDPPGWTTPQLLEAIRLAVDCKQRRAEQLATSLLQAGRIRRIGRGMYVQAKVA